MLESNAANGNEDYVADSEDEATKNFKVRVCTVRCWTRDPDQPQTLENKQLLTCEWWPCLCSIRSFMYFHMYTFLLTLSGSPSCSQNATTRPSTAHMSPLWGSTGSPAQPGRISCPFTANADEESVEFFPVRFSKPILMPRKCRSTCLWTIIFKNNNFVYICAAELR